jgi:hypothetical protein
MANKIFNFIHGKNRKMCFFCIISKFSFRHPVWRIFSACFIYGILNTHILGLLVTNCSHKECLRKGSKFICLQNLESKLYLTKICKNYSF